MCSLIFDLIRIFLHKDVAIPGYVTHWLAWKIARLDVDLLPFENVTQFNATLYSLLLNAENWYIANPEY